MRLAGPVGPDQPHPLAEVDLVRKRLNEPVDGYPTQVQDPSGGVAAAQPRPDLVVDHGRRRWALIHPSAPPRLGCVRPFGPVKRIASPLLVPRIT